MLPNEHEPRPSEPGRILGRLLARELTREEMRFIAGGAGYNHQQQCPTTICSIFGSGTEDDCSG
jgi:hypothetical protein